MREGHELGIHNSSWLESPDADIRDIRGLFGHESVGATQIYAHISAARQRRTVQLLEK